MNLQRLDMILAQFGQKKILVVGDFLLEKRLIVEQALGRTASDTGLEAHQVVEAQVSPSAAGAVASNLRALGVDALAVGVIGDDGEGFDLLRGLDAAGVNLDGLVIRTDRFTPTRIKPAHRVRGGALREMNRFDVANRAPLPGDAEELVIKTLRGLLPRVHGVVIVDRIHEENTGVITERVRDELSVLAQTYSEVPFVVESEERTGQFQNALIVASPREAVQAVEPDARWQGDGGPDWGPDRGLIERAGERLYRRNGQPVFITLGGHGVIAFHSEGPTLVPTVVGTGWGGEVGGEEAAAAGIAAALCAGASAPEAAETGCLAASVAARQPGRTGTASRTQLLELKRENPG